MVAAQLATVSFKQAAGFLRSRRPAGMSEVIGYLQALRKRIQCAVILYDLDPDMFYLAAREARAWSPESNDINPYIVQALGEINQVAPLDLDALEMNFTDRDQFDYLLPCPQGFVFGWDDWDEIGRNFGNYTPGMALYVLITCIRIGDVETLLNASEHYEWDLELSEDISGTPDIDWARLYILLDEHGLSHFKNALDACCYQTGNPYFDYNPFDEESPFPDVPSFNLEGVNELQQAWIDAQPIQEDLQRALQEFTADPSLAQVIWDLCVESMGEVSPQPARPHTLAEIFSGEEEIDGGNGRHQEGIDPFYGPIAYVDDDTEENW